MEGFCARVWVDLFFLSCSRNLSAVHRTGRSIENPWRRNGILFREYIVWSMD